MSGRGKNVDSSHNNSSVSLKRTPTDPTSSLNVNVPGTYLLKISLFLALNRVVGNIVVI
ncbi:MAG: hypothetical protein ACI8YQ_005083 [Polaribacter sp.]|jgi:hypothetical protein